MDYPVYVGASENLKGIRAVLAREAIKKDSVIEACPVIIFPNSELKYIEKTIINSYEYVWDDKHDCVVLGYGSIYNHSYTPNAYFTKNYENKTMDYIALRDIEKDEEITVNYNGDPDDYEKLDPEYLDFKN